MKHKKCGVFYLLPSTIHGSSEFDYQKKIVCNLVKKFWRLKNSILIACENKNQAEEIDEFLWNFDVNSFLPHDLFIQNLLNRTPITIYWSECRYDCISRDILINLMNTQMEFFASFNKIIDFVPVKNCLKECARIRFKSYKNIGFHLRVINA